MSEKDQNSESTKTVDNNTKLKDQERIVTENGQISEISKNKDNTKCMVAEKGRNSEGNTTRSTGVNNKNSSVADGCCLLAGSPHQSVLST